MIPPTQKPVRIKRCIGIKLWTINNIMRWTGFRFYVSPAEDEDGDTHVGILWWGWPNDMGEKRGG